MTEIDEQIKLIFDLMPSYLAKYGCHVSITKTDLKTVVSITAKERKFEIVFKEIKVIENENKTD